MHEVEYTTTTRLQANPPPANDKYIIVLLEVVLDVYCSRIFF